MRFDFDVQRDQTGVFHGLVAPRVDPGVVPWGA